MQSNLSGIPIKLIEPIRRPDPEAALPILAGPLHVICAQTLWISSRMSIVNDCTGAGSEAGQPGAGGKRERTTMILRTVKNVSADFGVFRVHTIVCEGFSPRIESIEGLVAADPEHAVPVLKERKDVRPSQAVRDAWLVYEHFEVVAVVAVQAVLCSKPDKSEIILHDLCDACLREAICCGDATDPEPLAGANGDAQDGCDKRLRRSL